MTRYLHDWMRVYKAMERKGKRVRSRYENRSRDQCRKNHLFGTLITIYYYVHCLPHGYKKKINLLAAYKQPRKKDQGKRKKERKMKQF